METHVERICSFQVWPVQWSRMTSLLCRIPAAQILTRHSACVALSLVLHWALTHFSGCKMMAWAAGVASCEVWRFFLMLWISYELCIAALFGSQHVNLPPVNLAWVFTSLHMFRDSEVWPNCQNGVDEHDHSLFMWVCLNMGCKYPGIPATFHGGKWFCKVH